MSASVPVPAEDRGLSWTVDRVEHGREDVTLLLDGERVGEAQIGIWPHWLFLSRCELDPGVPETVEIQLIERLLERYEERSPPRLTHMAITSLEVLRWYAASPLRDGIVLSGNLGGRFLFYDGLDLLDPCELDDPNDVLDAAPWWVTVMFGADFAAGVDELCGAPEVVGERWRGADGPWRCVALRRIATDPANAAPAEPLHFFAFTDHDSGVRQFASVQLSGHFDLCFEPDVARMVDALADPLHACRPFGGLPAGTRPEQARRNARFALFFTLGNIGWAAAGAAPRSWTSRGVASLRGWLRLEADRFTRERDAWLYEIVVRELSGENWTGIGIGEPIGLFDMCRYAVHRTRLVHRMGLADQNRFYWMVTAADALCPSPMNPSRMEGPDDGPVARVLYGPSPRDPTPEPADFPPQLRAPNPFAQYWPRVVE